MISNHFPELTEFNIVIGNAPIDLKNSDCYCYCRCCYWCYCYCRCYCDNACQWSQVWTNHHLSADHFPEVTSSNTPCSRYQHRRMLSISTTNIVKYSWVAISTLSNMILTLSNNVCSGCQQVRWFHINTDDNAFLSSVVYMLLVIRADEKEQLTNKITLINFLFEIQTSFHFDERKTRNIQTFQFSTPVNWSSFYSFPP